MLPNYILAKGRLRESTPETHLGKSYAYLSDSG